ncbi:MAG TPA: complex I NDUFA9 subunit family protein, partial [Gammaproteobacteria bacterium]|nr:complex I NDUFA9 subunit family protein [Gammaproteobacteria bacterium]
MTAQRKSICVLGGTGFVGRHLTRTLVEHGYSVTVPTRTPEDNRALAGNPDVRLVHGNVHDVEFLRQVVDDSNAVVNLIGILNERGHDGSGFRRVHTELASKLADVCLATQVTRFLQMSALKADAINGPSHYLRTKGEAERELLKREDSSLGYTIFRPSVIFGPEDSFINRFAQLLRLSPVLPLPCLGARFAPVYVGDVAEAFRIALESPATVRGTFELCGPEVWSLREILEYIRSTLGIRRMIFELPDSIGRLQAAIADYLIPGKPFSLDNFRSLHVDSLCSSDGLGSLGIERTPMQAIVPAY